MNYLTVIGAIIGILGLLAWWGASRTHKKNEEMLEEARLDAILALHYQQESKLSVKRGIQVYLQALTRQKDALQHLINELEEISEEDDKDDPKKSQELATLIRMNSEALENTEGCISQLETWYFSSYGKHYTLSEDGVQHFQFPNSGLSKN